LDAKSDRDHSADSSDTSSLVLDSIFYTKPQGFAQGANQKSYLKCTAGILGVKMFVWRRGFAPPKRGRAPSPHKREYGESTAQTI